MIPDLPPTLLKRLLECGVPLRHLDVCTRRSLLERGLTRHEVGYLTRTYPHLTAPARPARVRLYCRKCEDVQRVPADKRQCWYCGTELERPMLQ